MFSPKKGVCSIGYLLPKGVSMLTSKGDEMKITKIRPKFDIFMPLIIKAVKPIPKKVKKKKPRKMAVVKEIGNDTTEVVNLKGDKTLITITQKKKGLTEGFVVHIHRTYIKGGEYEEPDHFWLNHQQARMDAKDWVAIAKMTDW